MNQFYTYPITLDGDSVEQKREEILTYFTKGFELFESLFDLLADQSVFYKKSEPTRHPMIFYFGHTAVFFINKLILANIIQTRVDADFESIFAVGVDEMQWDDLNDARYKWPTVDEVKEYRNKVKVLVQNLIKTLPMKLPISSDDPFWIILMGCEHERIHIETSSVLHRQMPIEFVNESDLFKASSIDNPIVQNTLLNVDSSEVVLGKSNSHHLYGWDNEYGEDKIYVESFEASKYLVSNKEYLDFINDGGYSDLQYWDEEGRQFLQKTNTQLPPFWILNKNDSYSLRTLTKIIPMPWSWPVEVNCLEAKAFCKWKSKKSDTNYTLPTEAQFYALYNCANLEDVPKFDDDKANINLKHFASSVPVDHFEFSNGFFDVVGNVWQHTITPIYPFENFQVHPIYDDFSVPAFDNLHNLIKGGSWISTGNEMMKHSRYAFRRHFYQHAGFRYVKGDKTIDTRSFDDGDQFIEDQMDLHYNSDKIEQLYNFITSIVKRTDYNNCLEIGCSVGLGSFFLAKYIDKLTSIDTTARIIKEAIGQKSNFPNSENIDFFQNDPCNLKPIFKGFDLIVVNNIFHRVYNTQMMLQDLYNRIEANGSLIVVSDKTEDLSILHKEFTHIDATEVNGEIVSRWKKL
jgi:5-histidylcysteine sulfoxide synthase